MLSYKSGKFASVISSERRKPDYTEGGDKRKEERIEKWSNILGQ